MEYRITESSHGGYIVDKGLAVKGGESISGIIGYTMPAFIVYESTRFDTKQQAKNYIRRCNQKKHQIL